MTTHIPHRHLISKDEINLLPMGSYTGTIHVIDSDEKMSAAIHALRAEKVLGFDTETRPAFKKGESYLPSLVQLASSDGVYLFQLRHITSYGPLADVLGDARILKAGIAINDDLKKLNELFPFTPAGFVELANLAAGAGLKNAGIRGLAALIFGFRISKQTKCSRWDDPKLNHAQLVYAATDAWVCRELYPVLVKLPRVKKPADNRGTGKMPGPRGPA